MCVCDKNRNANGFCVWTFAYSVIRCSPDPTEYFPLRFGWSWWRWMVHGKNGCILPWIMQITLFFHFVFIPSWQSFFPIYRTPANNSIFVATVREENRFTSPSQYECRSIFCTSILLVHPPPLKPYQKKCKRGNRSTKNGTVSHSLRIGCRIIVT